MSVDTLSIFPSFVSIPSPHSAATSAHSGVSPSNSSAEDFDFDQQGDEDDEHDGYATQMVGGEAGDDKDTKKRSRRPPSTAAKRATHNAVERARRESLNGRFMELAQVLPNMSMSKRPSKNSIVEHAIEYTGTAQRRNNALTTENASLLKELNELRARLGMAPRAPLVIDDTPVGKPPSKRPSTVQNAPVKVAAPTPVAANKNTDAVSPRTASAPAVMPQAPFQAAVAQAPTMAQPQNFPAWDWSTAQSYGVNVFDSGAFNPAVYAPGTQTGNGAYAPVFAWPSNDLGAAWPIALA